jgi:hypothetical protein
MIYKFCGWDVDTDAKINRRDPIGTILGYTGTIAPTYYAFNNGKVKGVVLSQTGINRLTERYHFFKMHPDTPQMCVPEKAEWECAEIYENAIEYKSLGIIDNMDLFIKDKVTGEVRKETVDEMLNRMGIKREPTYAVRDLKGNVLKKKDLKTGMEFWLQPCGHPFIVILKDFNPLGQDVLLASQALWERSFWEYSKLEFWKGWTRSLDLYDDNLKSLVNNTPYHIGRMIKEKHIWRDANVFEIVGFFADGGGENWARGSSTTDLSLFPERDLHWGNGVLLYLEDTKTWKKYHKDTGWCDYTGELPNTQRVCRHLWG